MIGDASEAVITRLLADAAVAALVSTRVYPTILPQGPTFPAITVALASEERQSTFGGPTALPGSLYTVDCWGGDTVTAAKTLAKAVRLALDGAENWTTSPTTVTVQVSILEGGQRDSYEDDVKVHRVIQEYRLFWVEPQT